MRINSRRSIDPNSRWGKIVLAIFPLVGLGLLVGAWFMTMNTLSFLEIAAQATGKVVDLEYRRNTDGGGSYYPVVTYVAPDRQSYRFTGDVGSSPAAYDVGEAVEVLYDPGNYREAKINGIFSLWFGPAIMGFVGIAFSSVGAFAFVLPARKRKQQEWLRRHGRRIKARLSNVPQWVKKLDKDAMQGNIILAEWEDPATRKTYRFSSEALAQPYSYEEGGTVDVLIDPKNPKRYLVEPELERA